MKRDSAEFTILQSLNSDEIRSDPWNPAPNLLYTAERGDDAILCFERLFGCDNPPLQTVANVIDYIRQALEVTRSIILSFDHSHCGCTCTYTFPLLAYRGHADKTIFRACVFSTSTISYITHMATQEA